MNKYDSEEEEEIDCRKFNSIGQRPTLHDHLAKSSAAKDIVLSDKHPDRGFKNKLGQIKMKRLNFFCGCCMR